MNFYAISALVNFCTSFILGLFVIFKSRDKKNIGFFIFCFSVAFWSFAYYFWQVSITEEQALFWTRTLMAGAIFIPVAYLHFVYALVEILEKRKIFLIFSYLLFSIFLLTDFTPYFVSHIEPLMDFEFWPIAGPAYGLFLIIWFFYVVYSTYLLLKKYKDSTGIIRLQIKYVIIGMVIGFAGGSTNYFLWYRIPILPFANILVSVYVASIAYAILRYRLMDIRIVARKIFIYFGIAVFTYGVFYFLIWFYEYYFGSVFTSGAYIAGLFIAPLFVWLFYGAEKFLKHIANKYFFASLYNYQETINKLTDELNNYINLDKVIDLIVGTIKQTMQLERAGVLLVNAATKPAQYKIAKVMGFNEQNGISLVQDNLLTKHLSTAQKPLVRDELLLLSKDAKTKKDQVSFKKLYDNMERIEASLCLPLMSSKKLIGLVVLGGKISGDAYTKEDLELLNTLTKQAGIAIENAQLYQQVENFNKTLQTKVGEQTKDIQEKNQYLQELLNIKSDFLRVVNHQLNTPLSVIRNAYSMLEEKSIDAKKGFEYLGAGVKRMADTIKDFWDAYELEGKRMEAEPRETDITEIVDSQVKEKQQLPKTKEKNLTVSVVKPNFTVPKVFCDGKKITHVISNLLDNAVYYTPQGGIAVSYDIAADGKFLKIYIADTGIGIAPADQPNLFKKFSRGSGSTNIRPDGSGLGLYIAKKIIESNGGELKLERTAAGKGTTFSLTIPLYVGQKEVRPVKSPALGIFNGVNITAEQKQATVSQPQNTNSQNMINNQSAGESGSAAASPKILMVEDERSLVDMYHKYLMDKGYDFYTTPVIDEALMTAKTVPIDVVLLDIIIPKPMPDGSIYTMAEQGWDFLKLAKKDKKIKDIPIIVWTNLDNPDAKQKAKSLGAARFVVKSQVMAPELIKIIQEVLADRHRL